MEIVFQAIQEAGLGAKWQRLFELHWPAYRRWYLAEGIDARPTYAVARKKLRQHMPELLPLYEQACELAGGGDLAARFLSLYKPPAYLTGCSQVVWPGDEPLLIRNYDYAPAMCEGVILHTRWNGRKVVAMGDCLWGAIDGMNEAGLAVSLTFGGRRVVGDGFGMPLILRYILEFCDTTPDAKAVMRRMPSHMAYNVTAVDTSGRFMTALVAPDREPRITEIPIAANHQGRIDWHDYARATATLERERFLFFRLQDKTMTAEKLTACFLRSPLHTRAYDNGFGTLYTAVYNPIRGRVDYIWPDGQWTQSLEGFVEGSRRQSFYPASGVQHAGLS